MNTHPFCFHLSVLVVAATLAGCSDGPSRDRTAGEQSAADGASAWPTGNVYLRAGDRYPRSSSAVFYAPVVAAGGTTVSFGLAPNDAAADGHIVSGELKAVATIDASDPSVAHYADGACALTFRADNPGDPLDASIEVEETGTCPAFGGADPSGLYRPTMIGD